jgi:putative ABC transport system permease protein
VSRADDLRVAAKSLWAHRFRSGLTVLSIAVGALAIVFMSSLAQSGFETMKRGIEELGGARLILIVPREPVRAKARAQAYERGLTRQDQALVTAELPYLESATRYATAQRKDVMADSGTGMVADLVAADPQFLEFYQFALGRGRTFSKQENLEHARVCVVGSKVAEQLFHGDALGRRLTIGGLRCSVIGVLATSDHVGINMGFNWGTLVVVPAETVFELQPEQRFSTLIVLRSTDAERNDVLTRIINSRLYTRRYEIDDFQLINFAGFMQKYYAIFALMELIVGLIAGVALFIGGIGIMNMMLVSVSERVREIGIRKALGARIGHIRAQFLTEAGLLSLSGGILGALGGMALATVASFVIRQSSPRWAGQVSWVAVLAALGTALGTGLVFGWFPARRASLSDPVEAMRR